MGLFRKKATLAEFTQYGPKFECPEILKRTGVCVCCDCLKKEKCVIEAIARNSYTQEGRPCRQFIRSCSAKQDGNSKFADIALEELEEKLEREFDVRL